MLKPGTQFYLWSENYTLSLFVRLFVWLVALWLGCLFCLFVCYMQVSKPGWGGANNCWSGKSYHFKVLNLWQSLPAKEKKSYAIDVANFHAKNIWHNVWRLHFTDYIFCWLSQNPGFHFFLQKGQSEFHLGDLGGAIQDFSIALNMLEHISTSPPLAQLQVKALLMRAQCYFFLVRIWLSVVVFISHRSLVSKIKFKVNVLIKGAFNFFKKVKDWILA